MCFLFQVMCGVLLPRGLHSEAISQMNLVGVVPGPYSEVATMKDIQVPSVWLMENQDKSRHRWIEAKFYFRSLGQGILRKWSTARSRSGYLDRTTDAT